LINIKKDAIQNKDLYSASSNYYFVPESKLKEHLNKIHKSRKYLTESKYRAQIKKLEQEIQKYQESTVNQNTFIDHSSVSISKADFTGLQGQENLFSPKFNPSAVKPKQSQESSVICESDDNFDYQTTSLNDFDKAESPSNISESTKRGGHHHHHQQH